MCIETKHANADKNSWRLKAWHVYAVVSNITSKIKGRTEITLIFYFHFPFNELLTYSIFLQAKEYEGAATSAKNSYPYWDVKQYVQRKSCPNHCKKI